MNIRKNIILNNLKIPLQITISIILISSNLFRQLDGSTLNGIAVAEKIKINDKVMGSDKLVEAVTPKKSDIKLKKVFPRRKISIHMKTSPTETPNSVFSSYFNGLQAHFQSVIKSKAPMYLCITSYIIICLLGNIVTGILLVKHHFTSHEEMEIMNNLTRDVFKQQSRENATDATDADSGIEFEIDEIEMHELDQQMLYLNESMTSMSQNDAVS